MCTEKLSMDQKPTATAEKPQAEKPHVTVLSPVLEKFQSGKELSQLLPATYELRAGDIIPAWWHGEERGTAEIINVEPAEKNKSMARVTYKKAS